jgi:predicted nucleic acid-binding protein
LSIYADTSFLVSLYVLDANSAAAAARMKRAKLPLSVSSLGELELTNAICLRVFRKELSRGEAKAALTLIRNDIGAEVLRVTAISIAAFERAKRIARKQTPLLGSRTLDVLHVALALALKAEGFYTFDERQRRLAAAEGLAVF